MADILGGLISGAGPFLVSWVLPSGVALSLFAFVVFPSLHGISLADRIMSLGPTERGLLLAFGAIVVGIGLSSFSTALYRVLEGYSWPAPARRWGVAQQRARKEKIAIEAKASPKGWRQAILMERLQRFPNEDDQIAPTRLGNALRAFETYGVNRYRLDSQSFWLQLLSVVPSDLQKEVTQSRTSVDFYVCSIYVSLAFGLSALLVGILRGNAPGWSLVAWGVGAIILTRAWYRGALTATSYWHGAVRALVDLGRKPLAEAMGLELPTGIEQERAMWTLVAAFSFYPYAARWAARLDPYRARPLGDRQDPPSPGETAGGSQHEASND
jgi:hypothetical protein